MKKLVTTPLSGTIWWATVNDEKGMITGKRQDVTDNAITAVLDHFMLGDGFAEKDSLVMSIVRKMVERLLFVGLIMINM